jgi:GNAT superfamily N-acetyltransferase
VSVPEAFHRFWIALDEIVADVGPAPWGAVVTDPRSPDGWDLNYARIDVDGPVSIGEVESALLPALRSAGVVVEHVVSFHHEAHRELLEALASKGHRLGWDSLLAFEGSPVPSPWPSHPPEVEELVDRHELPAAVAAVLREGFEIEPDEAIEQLVRLDRDVLGPGGKRWFGVRDGARVVSAGTLLILGDTAYLDDVATLPPWRGRGFASAVVARIVDEARIAGAREVYLLADPEEPRVVAMYHRLGFRAVGRLASTRGPTPAA